MRSKLFIIALLISFLAQSQTYNVRRIVWSADFSDTLYLKSTSTPDSFWRKVDNVYVFAFKERVYNFLPYSQLINPPQGSAVAWADVTGKPATFPSDAHNHTVSSITDFPTTTAGFSNSADKNFVTDAQAAIINNTSGINTGDNAVNSLYSGLAASKQNTITTGTTAQYFKGDLSLATYSGYSINVQALTSSPADAQTIFFGMLPKAPTTTANISKIYIRQSGTIKRAEIYCYSGTAGTNEAWVMSIRLNNTTDTQIASVSAATSERVFSNTGLSIAVSAGDYVEIKCVNPTWATNPLTTIFGGYIYIE